MDNINLIEKAKSGNISALNTLLSANYPILQGYVIKMTGNIDIAQDIVQETMLKAVIHIKKFIPNAKFSTWLITIATNLYRDLLRKTKNLELISETIETNEISPERSVIFNIEYNAVKEILLKLPYEKRAVFILKHYYGYKYEEIAVILKCPIGTVRSRLHNCIKYIILELDRKGIM
ncbi:MULTISPECIES: RNA polymerase sigma factor SigY [Clostridium]|uniref:RNA polymerase sigma factor SigY n=1 Tax=Clostridium frigoriphilum TaxID=443253 RepID=A0ABU7UJS0_9CLOT|nr:RNA polymerase sigma factor SigY [Clostridium sp. DSM 17811]MBU3097973.1 RNA polymerase sigma factor SigY [Clostridium sp. DSM 17811]